MPRSSSRHVPKRITAYAKKCRSELCRNCVRSPRKHPQTPTFTGSHQEAFCGGKSLNRLCEEMFRCCSMQLAGVVFQACSFNHSDISPFRINALRAVAKDYRTRRRFSRPASDPVCSQPVWRAECARALELCMTFYVVRSLTVFLSWSCDGSSSRRHLIAPCLSPTWQAYPFSALKGELGSAGREGAGFHTLPST